jgi:hypothetical protein
MEGLRRKLNEELLVPGGHPSSASLVIVLSSTTYVTRQRGHKKAPVAFDLNRSLSVLLTQSSDVPATGANAGALDLMSINHFSAMT